ncbi:unnamed protein product [Leptosia nina]|uniref:Sulfotransferase domain-containing protein n=1 Tax=Leptosia nina TaxID=320188 RepID=A0AAV1J998_9NEOP
MANKNYPYTLEILKPPGTDEELETLPGLVRIGPKGYMFPEGFKTIAADVYNMEVKPSDVFVFSFPRSGTTWTQELVWLVANDLDYETASRIPLTDRYPFLEFSISLDEEMRKKLYEENKGDPKKVKQIEMVTRSALELLEATPPPRFIKTHLPLSLLPPNVLDAKMVYVARDPRDAIVSFYHLTKSMKLLNYKEDFKTFWIGVLNNIQPWTPYFDNVKESWEKRDHPNLLFLFYEDMRKDLPSSVRRVCDFFGKKYSDEQILKLCDHLSFDNFKKNSSVNYDLMKELGFMYADQEFVRKGKTGGWRDYFDEEMVAQADKWIADNLKDTDLQFPSMIN